MTRPLRDAVDGDTGAEGSIYQKVRKHLYRFADYLLRRYPLLRNQQEADDVLNTLWVQSRDELLDCQGSRQFWRAARRCLGRAIWNINGHEQRHQQGRAGVQVEDLRGSGSEPHAEIVKCEMMLRFKTAIETLSDDDQELIQFHYWFGFKQGDIAEMQGKTRETINRQLKAARGRLTQEIRKANPDDLSQWGRRTRDSIVSALRELFSPDHT